MQTTHNVVNDNKQAEVDNKENEGGVEGNLEAHSVERQNGSPDVNQSLEPPKPKRGRKKKSNSPTDIPSGDEAQENLQSTNYKNKKTRRSRKKPDLQTSDKGPDGPKKNKSLKRELTHTLTTLNEMTYEQKLKEMEKFLQPGVVSLEEVHSYKVAYLESLKKVEESYNKQQTSAYENLRNFIQEKDGFKNCNKEAGLEELENYLHGEDGGSKLEFENGLSHGQVMLVMLYKIMRGKFRASLVKLIKENSNDECVQATKEVYQKIEKSLEAYKKEHDHMTFYLTDNLSDIEAWTKQLTALRGVGPATASYLLSLFHPIFPIMSDEALYAHLGQGASLKYDLTTFLDYVSFVTSTMAKIVKENSEKEDLDVESLPLVLERIWFMKTQ